MLYILMHSPFVSDVQMLLGIIDDEDELLLLSDGVIAGISDSFMLNNLMTIKVSIYALKDDVMIRGLFDNISEMICMINYVGFVKLTEKHCSCFSW